jgi:osmotically-inducible protein OsmY
MSELTTRVMTALADNPQVHPDEIAVETVRGAVDGTDVRLRGTVGSLFQVHQAVATVRDVPGVRAVMNDLSVRLMGADGRADAGTEATTLEALIRAGDVPLEEICVEADRETVTLRGEVDTASQRERAEAIARRTAGVSRVRNRLQVRG